MTRSVRFLCTKSGHSVYLEVLAFEAVVVREQRIRLFGLFSNHRQTFFTHGQIFMDMQISIISIKISPHTLFLICGGLKRGDIFLHRWLSPDVGPHLAAFRHVSRVEAQSSESFELLNGLFRAFLLFPFLLCLFKVREGLLLQLCFLFGLLFHQLVDVEVQTLAPVRVDLGEIDLYFRIPFRFVAEEAPAAGDLVVPNVVGERGRPSRVIIMDH